MLTSSSPTLNRKQPIEKGPFGRTTNRRPTRSKTATPATREDFIRLENFKAQDEVFSKFKTEMDEQQQQIQQQQPTTRASPDKIRAQRPTIEGVTGPDLSKEPVTAASGPLAEPTEILIYGYTSFHFPASLTFYENASRGRIYEDYDRSTSAPSSFGLGLPIPTLPRSLPRSWLRKIKEYKGGEHWIKVTLDSPRAADLACRESPHVIGGCLVFAELWRGLGPAEDTAIMAASGTKETARGMGTVREGASRQPGQVQEGVKDWSSVPLRMHGHSMLFGREGPWRESTSSQDTADVNGNTTSTATAGSSNTLPGSDDPTLHPNNTSEPENVLRRRQQQQQDPSSVAGSFPQEGKPESVAPIPQQPPQGHQQMSLRIPTAKRIILKPASSALLPTPPWPTRVFGNMPIISSLFFSSAAAETQSTGGIIGPAVPRNEKGEFDWVHASLWWCFCWWLDKWLGSDLCGLKEDD